MVECSVSIYCVMGPCLSAFSFVSCQFDFKFQVSILNDGVEIFHNQIEEAILRPEDDHPNVVPPFNAYSYQGEPEVCILFVLECLCL